MSDAVTRAQDMVPRTGSQGVPSLMLHDISRVYGSGDETLQIFRNVNAQLVPGEIVALVGPSGSGKSSLLHICGLLEPPTTGNVVINGRDCSRLNDDERTRIRREQLGFVYQFHHLLPEFNALENVAMPQLIGGRRTKDAEALALRLLTMVGLAQRVTHRPGKLSGGEQQRVAIARALANQPRVILADEPTGNLDPATREEVLNFFADLCREGRTVIMVTHDPAAAARAGRTFKLADGGVIYDSAKATSRVA